MTDDADLPANEDDIGALRARTEVLERQLAEVQTQASARLVQMALKAEALRAGMVDLDGLKFVDSATLAPDNNGELHGAASLIAQLRRDKPWLFGGSNSSSVALPPSPVTPRRKLATEMSLEEWRTARAELLRRR